MESTLLPSCTTTDPSTDQLWNHDVYLSYRGEDTRKNFVDHLYTALHQQGILTYIDDKTLPLGEQIKVTLFKAIQESRIAIVVFSENFARSSFCLEELANIMKCKKERGQIVMPIFYYVDPSDVRFQKREFELYAEANTKKVETWRKALKDASDLNGWVIEHNGGESRHIKSVVNEISHILLHDKNIHGKRARLHDAELGGDDSLAVSSKLGNRNVFMSFRGKDTRNTFVDHLHSALEQQGINTYMSLPLLLGESIGPSHFKVIEESQIAVIIFSRYYVESLRCLDELAYIMKCRDERGQIVIPVFYHVHPSEVRNQSGVYGEAFLKHYQMEEITKVESWRKALVSAGNLYGWEIGDAANGYESKGVKLIVDTILKRFFPDKGLIGAHTRLEGLKYGDGSMTALTSSPKDVEHLKIPLQEIHQATENFATDKIIARGGFGEVYQGQTEQLGTVAVKVLNRSEGQGDHEFMTEIELLSTYKSEYIVTLIGYCDADRAKILVYRYEKNGSLNNHLHNKKDLTWIRRLCICLDAARGLEYLHDDVQHQHIIVHRDVKSSNILLDETWKAKISDFGLCKIALANVPCSVIFSTACGTRGYIDPLYQEHNMLTQKSDVYSFGIVMLEVLFGRLVIPKLDYLDERYFSVRLAQDLYEKKRLDEIIDSDLRSRMNSDSLSTFSSIAFQCLKKRREERPTMSLVVDQLEKALDYQQGSSGYLHDVYISFRDRDTECHIVDDIRAALDHDRVSTYKNDVTHSRKESILLKAIERSRFFVIVFTKKFAVNSWYLDEVAKIIECMKDKQQFVLPVFYNVSHYDVRTQKGYFGEVISEYDTHPRIEVWKNALVEATNAPGLEYSKFRCSADLVKKIVEEIKNGLSSKFDGGH